MFRNVKQTTRLLWKKSWQSKSASKPWKRARHNARKPWSRQPSTKSQTPFSTTCYKCSGMASPFAGARNPAVKTGHAHLYQLPSTWRTETRQEMLQMLLGICWHDYSRMALSRLLHHYPRQRLLRDGNDGEGKGLRCTVSGKYPRRHYRSRYWISTRSPPRKPKLQTSRFHPHSDTFRRWLAYIESSCYVDLYYLYCICSVHPRI